MRNKSWFVKGIINLTLVCVLLMSVSCSIPIDNGGGGNNGGGGGGTRQEGVYIGIISFAGDAVDLTDGTPVFLDNAGLNSLRNKLNSEYAISNKAGTALFYAVHKALNLLKGRETQYPPGLELVDVVTFTDGLDNGSIGLSTINPIEDKAFSSDNDYTAYLNSEIGNRKIAGKSITAYSVGVRGDDVQNINKFQNDLANIASLDKSQSLTDFGNLKAAFQGIAGELVLRSESTTFTMKTTLLAGGTKVRMTFDIPSSADVNESAKYIEGTITVTGTGSSTAYTFGSITYVGGLGSDQGLGPITGRIDGPEVNFVFTGVTGYNPNVDKSKVKQWLMPPGSQWQINSEYDVGGAISEQFEKRSAVIYLVLDSSRSLNTTQIGQIRDAADDFITSLYNQLNDNGGGNNGGNDGGDNNSGGGSDSGGSGDNSGDGSGIMGSSPSNAIVLSATRTVQDYILSPSAPAVWYSFYTDGQTYYLSGRDRHYVYADSYTADVTFEIYDSTLALVITIDTGTGDYREDSYYSTSNQLGTWYVKVVPFDGSSENYGTYAIAFYNPYDSL